MRKLYLGGLTAALLCSVAFAPPNEGGDPGNGVSIESSLRQLDADNDQHWTSGGLPDLKAVGALVGRTVSRSEVTEANPGFMRPTTSEAEAIAENGDGDAPIGDADDGEFSDEAPAERRVPTATEIADAVPDAILLLEAVAAVASGERYQRNSTLQTLVRGYQTSQAEIKATQQRVDARLAERAAAQAAAAEAAKVA